MCERARPTVLWLSFGLRRGTSFFVDVSFNLHGVHKPGNLGEIYIMSSWISSIHRKIKYYFKLQYYLCVHRIGQATNWELGKKIVDPEVHCLTTLFHFLIFEMLVIYPRKKLPPICPRKLMQKCSLMHRLQ